VVDCCGDPASGLDMLIVSHECLHGQPLDNKVAAQEMRERGEGFLVEKRLVVETLMTLLGLPQP
jgi:hypothetical protein